MGFREAVILSAMDNKRKEEVAKERDKKAKELTSRLSEIEAARLKESKRLKLAARKKAIAQSDVEKVSVRKGLLAKSDTLAGKGLLGSAATFGSEERLG